LRDLNDGIHAEIRIEQRVYRVRVRRSQAGVISSPYEVTASHPLLSSHSDMSTPAIESTRTVAKSSDTL